MDGDLYTITFSDGSGTLVDPPGNEVFVLLAQTTTSEVVSGDPFPGLTQTVMEPATRTSQGTYSYRFRPQIPGHYLMIVDAGGQYRTERHLEVSPVVL